MIAACIALAIATLFDIASTIIGLNIGMRERAPVMRWVMTWAGTWWPAVKVAIACAAAVLFWRAGLPAGIWAAAAVTGAVALNNIRLIAKR